LIKTVEPMALLLCQARVGSDGSQEFRGEERVNALEELEEEERFTGISRTQAYSASGRSDHPRRR